MFQKEYKNCCSNGIFEISDEIMKRFIIWHRLLCHPTVDRLRWTFKNATGINLNTSDVRSLPCEACDMGKSIKYATNERRPRISNVGERWHCYVDNISPISVECYKYFCLTNDDVFRYRIFMH